MPLERSWRAQRAPRLRAHRGLHHAARDRAAGFCVFNDCGVAIELLRSATGSAHRLRRHRRPPRRRRVLRLRGRSGPSSSPTCTRMAATSTPAPARAEETGRAPPPAPSSISRCRRARTTPPSPPHWPQVIAHLERYRAGVHHPAVRRRQPGRRPDHAPALHRRQRMPARPRELAALADARPRPRAGAGRRRLQPRATCARPGTRWCESLLSSLRGWRAGPCAHRRVCRATRCAGPSGTIRAPNPHPKVYSCSARR